MDETTKRKDENPPAAKVHTCIPCNRVFRSRAALVQHEDAKHPMETTEGAGIHGGNKEVAAEEEYSKKEKQVPAGPPAPRWKCDFCRSTFDHFDLLEQHVIRHNLWSDDGPVTIHKCDFCPKTFYSDEELEEHIRTTYRFPSPDEWEDTDGESDEENCEESNEVSNEEKERKQEPVEKPGENSAEKQVAALPPPQFKCRDCDEAFYFNAALAEHQDTFAHGPMATREKKPESDAGRPAPQFKCIECDEVFYFGAMRLEHEKKTGHGPSTESKEGPAEKPVEVPAEKPVAGPPPPPFKCEDCSEAFYFVAMLTEHERKLGHGPCRGLKKKPVEKPAEKPTTEADAPIKKVISGYRCRPCDKSFRNQHLLVKHWEKAHEDTWLSLFDQDNISEESLSYSDFQNFDNYDEDDMLNDLREINSWSSKKNKISCITCWKKFRTSSQMMEHVEMRECHSYIDARSIKWAIDTSDQSVVSRCYSDGKFQCPSCEARFDSLSSLIRHAEGDKCSAEVSRGPLKAFVTEVRWRMIEGEHF